MIYSKNIHLSRLPVFLPFYYYHILAERNKKWNENNVNGSQFRCLVSSWIPFSFTILFPGRCCRFCITENHLLILMAVAWSEPPLVAENNFDGFLDSGWMNVHYLFLILIGHFQIYILILNYRARMMIVWIEDSGQQKLTYSS